MDRELTRQELDELLELFALDALEGEERAQVARYVAREPAARAEVDSLREAASYLPHPARPAPEALWSEIQETLRAQAGPTASLPARPLTPPIELDRRRERRRRRLDGARHARLFAVAAAVVALLAVSAIALLIREVADQQDRIDALATAMHDETAGRQAAMARTMPGAHTARLESGGDTAAQVVMLPDGSGWFVHSDLAALPAGRTYQLWAVVDDGAGKPQYVSVGVLGREPGSTAFRASAPVSGFAVSEEPAGGATTPGRMVASGDMA